MSESNNNIPMRITQLEEATSYPEGAYLPIAKAGYGTKKISCDIEDPATYALHENISERYVPNYANILKDWTLSSATALDDSTTIEDSSDSPSKVIYISRTGNDNVGASIDLGTIFNNGSYVNGKYYLHFKAKANRNEAYAYQSCGFYFWQYMDSRLKGSFSKTIDSPSADPTQNEYKEYILEMNFNNASVFNKFHIYAATKYDYWIKDIYIIKETDNELGYCVKILSPEDVENMIEGHGIVKPSMKIAIIGDSLSAQDASVNIKYHDLLHTNDNYTVTNLAVSGSSYTNGSLKGGTRNHQFYNQALQIPTDTEGVLVFGSFNDMSQLGGTFWVYNSSDVLVTSGTAGEAPSSSATLLSTDESSAHWFTHNATEEIPSGVYRMICNNKTYQFSLSSACPSGGKIKIRVVTLGEIGTDDADVDTIVGAFSTMINNIYSRNNGAIIGIISPTPWVLYNNVSPYSQSAFQNCNAYVSKLKELAVHFMLPFMNLYEESNLRPWNENFRNTYYNNADGVHPNNLGHLTFIYPHMREFARTLNPKNI